MPIKQKYVTWALDYTTTSSPPANPTWRSSLESQIDYDVSIGFPDVKTPCRCSHFRGIPTSGTGKGTKVGGSIDNRFIHARNFPGYISHPRDMLANLKFNSFIKPPKPDSSGFGLIQFIAELDESVALLTKNIFTNLLGLIGSSFSRRKKITRDLKVSEYRKFRKRHFAVGSGKLAWDSFGEVNWGWIPIINDIFNFIETIENLSRYADNSRLSLPQSKKAFFKADSVNYVGETSTYRYDYQGVIRYFGILRPNTVLPGDIAYLLRQIGVDLDFSIAWDLIPLSFMVNWFLPNLEKIIHEYSPLVASVRWDFLGYYDRKITGKQRIGLRSSFDIDVTAFSRTVGVNQTLMTDSISLEPVDSLQTIKTIYLLLGKLR